jgi:hypothetical protein
MLNEQELNAVRAAVREELRAERERAAKRAEEQQQSAAEQAARAEREWLGSLRRSTMSAKLKSDVIQKHGIEVYNSIPWSDAEAQQRFTAG